MLYSDKGLLFDVFDRLGLPINYFVYVFADQIATFPMGFKWLGLLSHFMNSLLMFSILNSFGLRTLRQASLPVALLFAVNPFSISTIEPTHLFYSLSYTALLLAILIINKGAFLTQVRFCSLAMLLVFAFNTASLLLVYLGWLFAQCFDQIFLKKRKPQKGTVLQFAFLFCFPFVFWLLKNLFFSPHGDQENYNSLVFDLAVIIYLFLKVPEMFLRLFFWELNCHMRIFLSP